MCVYLRVAAILFRASAAWVVYVELINKGTKLKKIPIKSFIINPNILKNMINGKLPD